MQSCFLSVDVVQAYLRDLDARLRALPKEIQPSYWCPLGPSGVILAQRFADIARSLPDGVFPVVWKRGDDVAVFEELGAADTLRGQRVLVLDTALHTGATMLASLRLLQHCSAKSVTSFALVVRSSSMMVPNYFSLLINDTDRAWVPNETLDNQRLTPNGLFRRLCHQDVDRPMIRTGADFIDRVSWSDRLYDVNVDASRQVYVVEIDARIVGFVSFVIRGDTIRIDEVAVDDQARGRRYGAYLIRWAENFARHRGCRESILWSIEERVPFYRKYEYESTEESLTLGHDGRFVKMRKRILYNLLNPPA